MHPHPSHSILPPAIGFGTFGSTKELNERLSWWKSHPKLAATPRGKERIAALMIVINQQAKTSRE